MNKTLFFVIVSTFSTSCFGVLKSLPYPTYYQILDYKAADFTRKYPSINLKNLGSQSERYLKTMRQHEIMVTSSGGGARAAAFTLGVLAELEILGSYGSKYTNKNALVEIDYFSTVSGGGWGVGAYLASRKKNNTKKYSLNLEIEDIKKGFLDLRENDNACLANMIEMGITTDLKFSDLYKEKNARPTLPYLFSNAAIIPSQSPFIFTQEYLDNYEIDTFFSCDTPDDIDDDEYEDAVTAALVVQDVSKGINAINVSLALAISGSVPGFYHSYATTKICENNNHKLYESSFCNQGKNDLHNLLLVDGGIHGNYGYLTALEIMDSIPDKKEKVIIVIDTNADTEVPFSRNSHNESDIGIAISVAGKFGFPARASAFNRMYERTEKAENIKQVRLDFFSVANYTNKLTKFNSKDILKGLKNLENHTNRNINCFKNDGELIVKARKFPLNYFITEKTKNLTSIDCKNNNFYRSELLAKTTYELDEVYFDLIMELGRLAVRLNSDKLYETIFLPK